MRYILHQRYMEIVNISEIFKNTEFSIFKAILENPKGMINAIVAKNSADKFSRKDLDKLTTYDINKIAIGEPESVPAGKYATEVLDNTNLYDKVKDKLVLAKDVKEVLAWVQQGNADVGFVYLSDAFAAKGIKIALTTDEDTHSAINYPIAVLKESKNQNKAKAFEDFLLSDDGQVILENYGFKKAKLVILIGFLCNAFMVLYFQRCKIQFVVFKTFQYTVHFFQIPRFILACAMIDFFEPMVK